MKTIRIVPILALAAVLGLTAPRAVGADLAVRVSFSLFHAELAPYGTWVTIGGFGDAWVPSGVSRGWQPYSVGEWIYTDFGWTWVSSDRWGSDPYHYGTWTFVEPYGWVWIPGYVWAPAWVTWSYSDAYIGWAPVPPTFDFSVSGYRGSPVVLSPARYVFVPANHFVGVDCERARVPVASNTEILPRTTRATRFAVSGGYIHAAGPPVKLVDRRAHTHVRRSRIEAARTAPARISAWGGVRDRRVQIVSRRTGEGRSDHGSVRKQPKAPSRSIPAARRGDRPPEEGIRSSRAERGTAGSREQVRAHGSVPRRTPPAPRVDQRRERPNSSGRIRPGQTQPPPVAGRRSAGSSAGHGRPEEAGKKKDARPHGREKDKNKKDDGRPHGSR
jgi:hypothetical protein